MTKDEEGYNGWTNYETWAVKLWMDNDEGSYRLFKEMAENHVIEFEKDAAPWRLADAIKDEISCSAPDLGASMYADLLGSALDNVNWREIAESLIEDLA
jgi:hypothetical protein